MKAVYITLALLFSLYTMRAQTITGRVKDGEGDYVKGATVTLKKVTDSAIVSIGVSDTMYWPAAIL